MKKIKLVLVLMVLVIGNAFSQTISYNPFTQNIHFEPEPTIQGFSCGTVQTVAFTQGLTTSANANAWQTEPLKVRICITGFVFNGPAASVVTGSYASNFDWAFDPAASNCIIGTQNQVLIGTGSNPVFPDPLSSGSIKLSLLVPATSPVSTILSVDVSLEIPVYMQAFNSIPDDNESTQTQTYCALSISGNVYHDIDTLLNLNDVNGTPIDTPGGVQLYANLINSNGLVVGVTPILPNGTYEFLNVTPNTTYTIELSINQGTIGQPKPVCELPPLWENTGEDCCDQVGNDGNKNGIITVNIIDVSISHVDFGIVGPPPTSLPVVLSGFFVNAYNCAALLSWATAQEENTSHVEIFRREQSQSNFKKIATVRSAGNSQTEKLYSYLDLDVSKDNNYEYQLRFVDIDKQFSLSDVKHLKLECAEVNTSINLYPNPAIDKLNILYITEEDNLELSVEIVDIAGRSILSKTQYMKSGGSVMNLDINALSNGTYILHYKDADGLSVGSIKFIKQ